MVLLGVQGDPQSAKVAANHETPAAPPDTPADETSIEEAAPEVVAEAAPAVAAEPAVTTAEEPAAVAADSSPEVA